MCPYCSGLHLAALFFDHGACFETGYRDAGEQYQCLTCGATGDPDELLPEPAALPASIPCQPERGLPASLSRTA